MAGGIAGGGPGTAHRLPPGRLRKTFAEQKHLKTEVMAEIRDGGAMPDGPVIVLAARGIDPFQAALIPQAQLRELSLRKAGIYRPMAGSVPAR
jgi:hypothetical protein